MEHLKACAQGQALLQFQQVVHGDGHGGGVKGGGGGALELARLGVDLVGDADVRDHAAQGVRDPAFVHRVGVGVQQADRDGLDAAALEPGEHSFDLGVSQGFDDSPGVV